jgi:hypothetical protein
MGTPPGIGKRAVDKAISTDVQEGGCGLCALGAVMRNLTGNESIDPGKLATKYGHFHNSHGTKGDAFSNSSGIPKDYGCSVANIDIQLIDPKTKKVKQTPAQVKAKFDAALDSGAQIVICGGKFVGPFWGGGHYVYIGKHNKQLDHYHIGNSWLIAGGMKDFDHPYNWDNLIIGMTAAWAIRKK